MKSNRKTENESGKICDSSKVEVTSSVIDNEPIETEYIADPDYVFQPDDVVDDSDTKGYQNGDVNSKKSAILPIGKSTKRKRSVHTNPKSMKQCKDEVVRRVFDDASKKIKQLQNLTTFESETARNANPRSCHMFVTYDEVVKKPSDTKFDMYKLDNPIWNFLLPPGVNVQCLGQKLVQVGHAMIRGHTDAFNTTETFQDYHEYVFGEYHQNKRPADYPVRDKGNDVSTGPQVENNAFV